MKHIKKTYDLHRGLKWTRILKKQTCTSMHITLIGPCRKLQRKQTSKYIPSTCCNDFWSSLQNVIHEFWSECSCQQGCSLRALPWRSRRRIAVIGSNLWTMLRICKLGIRASAFQGFGLSFTNVIVGGGTGHVGWSTSTRHRLPWAGTELWCFILSKARRHPLE